MEETRIPKSCRAENAERKEKNLSFEWTSTPRLNEYPKKRLVHAERDNY